MPAEITGVHLPEMEERADRAIRKVVLPGQTPEGKHILSVLVKRSYDIVPGKPCVRAETDRKLVPGDVHYGDPMCSSVKFESDFVPFKPATDVVLNGLAHAPGGKPVETLDVSLSVGPFRKDLLVIGDRVAKYREKADPLFTDPEPFTTMEIRYERAYGGVDVFSDTKVQCAYARNPLGRGFVVANTRKTVDGLSLPNVEDPRDPLMPGRLCAGHFMNWERQPQPAGFGWIPKYWRPRALYAGVMPADRPVEQELRKAYAAAVPPGQKELYEQTRMQDMDFRFFNGASPDLVLPFLSGTEEIRLFHLDQAGERTFRLPGDRPEIGLDIGGGILEPEAVLHTVQIRMEEGQVDLIWRGAVPYAGPEWLPQMRKMEVHVR